MARLNGRCAAESLPKTHLVADQRLAVVGQRVARRQALGHVERPEDLHGAVIFLASAASNYVTGHDLMVDGGHTLNAWLTPLGLRCC